MTSRSGPGHEVLRLMTVRSAAPCSRRIRVDAGDRMVAAYRTGAWRPHVYPLLTPSGFAVADEAPADHHYHRSE